MGLDALAKFKAPTVEIAPDKNPDEFMSAIPVAIVGVGQAGGRIADAAWELGFRRVVAINTSREDLGALRHVPSGNRFVYGSGGSGKDPSRGRKQFDDAAGAIYDFLASRLGEHTELVLVTAGAGGGTGSGALLDGSILRLARQYIETTQATRKGVGLILTLPEPAEGAGTIENAKRVLQAVSGDGPEPPYSPLIVVDNARVTRMWGSVSITQKWPTANTFIMSAIQAFLMMAAEQAIAYTFDPVDLWKLWQSGALVLGFFDVQGTVDATSLADAVRKGVGSGLMATGARIQDATQAAILFAGSTQALDGVRTTDFEYASHALQDMVHGTATIHRGVYEAPIDGIRVFTAIGGMPVPAWPSAE